MTTSKVDFYNGAPVLFINEKVAEGVAYITYMTNNSRYDDFAAAGYRLFSMPVYFGYNRLNEQGETYVFTRGIFDDREADFAVFDADVEKILKACPDAYILPRVCVNQSENWEAAHPDEVCELDPETHRHRASMASDVWAAEIKRQLSEFVAHIESSHYRDHIAGYQIAGGNTEEWFPMFSNTSISGKRAEEKYARFLEERGLERTDANFYRFYSNLVASRIKEFAAHVKMLTERRLAVGTFYGYIFECTARALGHFALESLLESDDIDFICSPVGYCTARAAGEDHPYMVPLASLKLRGKLYFSENDTRTHLTRAFCDNPRYNTPIWFGPDCETTMEIMKMHEARVIVNDHSAWWFDMWGGWYADERYMSLLDNLRRVREECRDLPRAPVAEVAIFVDENSYFGFESIDVPGKISLVRRQLGKTGAPYELYIAQDAERVIDKYKAVLILNPANTPDSLKVIELAKEKNISCLNVTIDNADISTAELREFLRDAGVHIYCEKDAVIYANESVLFLHTCADSAYKIDMKSDATLTDILSGEEFDESIVRKKGQSFILRINQK